MNDADIERLVRCYPKAEQSEVRKLILPSEERHDDWIATAGPIEQKGTFTVGTIEYMQDDKKVDTEIVVFVRSDGKWKASEDELMAYLNKYGPEAN